MGMGPFEVGPAGDNFVLFCEFECLKEQRGPVLLQFTNVHGTISADTFIPLQQEAFQDCLNDFILRIMTQDSHASNQEELEIIPFAYPPDSQVVLHKVRFDTFSCSCLVHHFVLLDLEARGYIRPFCLVYLTAHEEELHADLLVLMKVLDVAASMLKRGADATFQTDLRRRLVLLALGYAHHSGLGMDQAVQPEDIANEIFLLLGRFKDFLAQGAADTALQTAVEVAALLAIPLKYTAADTDQSPEDEAAAVLEACMEALLPRRLSPPPDDPPEIGSTSWTAAAKAEGPPVSPGATPPPAPPPLPAGTSHADVCAAVASTIDKAPSERRLRAPGVLCHLYAAEAQRILSSYLALHHCDAIGPSLSEQANGGPTPLSPALRLTIGGCAAMDLNLQAGFHDHWLQAGVAAVKAACHGGSPAVEPAGPRAGPPPGPVCREASLDSDRSDGTAYATPPESADGLLGPRLLAGPVSCPSSLPPMTPIMLSGNAQGAPAGRRGARPEHAAAQSRPGPALVAGQPAGTGLLAFRSTYSWARHAAFAALTGWTVVVRGADREQVVKAVRALALFVPHISAGAGRPEGRAVVLWREGPPGPLRLPEAARCAILGGAGLEVPAALARRCAIADLDEGVWTGPEYGGGVLDHLLYGLNRSWRSAPARPGGDEGLFLVRARGKLLEIINRVALLHQHLYGVSSYFSEEAILPHSTLSDLGAGAPAVLSTEASRFLAEVAALRGPPEPLSAEPAVLSPRRPPAGGGHSVGQDADVYRYLAELARDHQLFGGRSASRMPSPGPALTTVRTPHTPRVRLPNEIKPPRPKASSTRGDGGHASVPRSRDAPSVELL